MGVSRSAEDKRVPGTSGMLRLFDQAYDWFFLSYVFLTVFLPGGSVYGFNYKYPLYAGLLPLAVYSAFHRGQIKAAQGALLLGVPAILCGWLVLGLSHGFNTSGAVRQFLDIFLTLLLCWMASIYCDKQESRRLGFLRFVLVAEMATAVLKISLILYSVLRGIPVVQTVAWLDQVFGSDLMTMDLGALFGRIQFVSDELIPISIFIVLRYRDRLGFSNLRASLSVLLLLISALFGFSRYVWAFTAVALLLGIILGKRDRFQAVLIGLLGVSVLACLPALTVLYQLRFSTEVAGGSDAVRNAQIPALESFFADAPFFGHGLGSYTTAMIRTTVEAGRASYEIQLLALPAQMGVFGIVFFLGLGVYYYRGLWWRSTLPLADQLGIAVLLIFWIAAGFTNPFLFSPIAGVNYAALATLSAMTIKKRAVDFRSYRA